jgi:UDP-N-acetylglucosamine--N-acetylmuramyl-(pentapeptide) pyrophosphoryl-undecaprenol N-acetylglucosamine transferase
MKGSRGAFAVCGGGTGGHIFPALAVAEALKRQAPDRPIYYFGKTDGMERGLSERAHLPFIGLEVSGFARCFAPSRQARALFQAGRSFLFARRKLVELKVNAVLGTGGFVCGPVMLAATTLGIPTIIHESNYIPGVTNRLLGPWVTAVAVSQEETEEYFSRRKVVWTGFPLRVGLTTPNREQGCACFGLNPEKRVLFIFPGSLAAHRINQAVAQILGKLLKKVPDLQVLWMTGEADYAMAGAVAGKYSSRVQVRPFIHDVPEAYAAADIVVARAGAGTVAELSATAKPALLIPYPHAAANHQVHNAAILQKAGSAEVLADAGTSGPVLLDRLGHMLKRLKPMTECAAVMAAVYPRKAAEHLADLMIGLGGIYGERKSRKK